MLTWTLYRAKVPNARLPRHSYGVLACDPGTSERLDHRVLLGQFAWQHAPPRSRRPPTDFTPQSCGTWLTAQRVPDRVVIGILDHIIPGVTASYQPVMQSMVDDASIFREQQQSEPG